MKKAIFIIILFSMAFLTTSILDAAKYANISVKRGNVRTCPSMDCDIKFYMWKYTPVEMLSTSDDKEWVEVKEFEGYRGWVHKTLLGETPGMSAKQDVNVRSGAGDNNPAVWVVKKGYSFKFLERKGNWYKVTDDAETTGWVYNRNLWGFTKYTK